MVSNISTEQPLSSLQYNEDQLSQIKDNDIYLRKYIDFKKTYNHFILIDI